MTLYFNNSLVIGKSSSGGGGEDLAEIYPVIETYQSGSSWYRVYSDGWCEQGELVTTSSTVTYLKAFNSSNYTLIITPNTSQNSTTTVKLNQSGWTDKTATGFTTYADTNNTKEWVAFGYIGA